MAKYRKKPIVIEAKRLSVDNQLKICDWIGSGNRQTFWDSGEIDIITLEGTMRAHIGDWIIKGVSGEFYPCKPDIFELTYELVGE